MGSPLILRLNPPFAQILLIITGSQSPFRPGPASVVFSCASWTRKDGVGGRRFIPGYDDGEKGMGMGMGMEMRRFMG